MGRSARGISVVVVTALKKEQGRLCMTCQRERCQANSPPEHRGKVLHLRALMPVRTSVTCTHTVTHMDAVCVSSTQPTGTLQHRVTRACWQMQPCTGVPEQQKAGRDMLHRGAGEWPCVDTACQSVFFEGQVC